MARPNMVKKFKKMPLSSEGDGLPLMTIQLSLLLLSSSSSLLCTAVSQSDSCKKCCGDTLQNVMMHICSFYWYNYVRSPSNDSFNSVFICHLMNMLELSWCLGLKYI